MEKNYTFLKLFKRLYWDILDPDERKYYFYFLIWQIPGLFGNALRAKYLSKKFKKAGNNLSICAGTRFRSMENLIVGDNVSIGYDNFIQSLGGVAIGNNTLLGPGVKIWSVNHNYQKKSLLICQQGQTLEPVVIGDDVWLGSNVFVCPGVVLPDGVLVSAGSVVSVKKYLPYSIIAGNPGRVIGYRKDKDNGK